MQHPGSCEIMFHNLHNVGSRSLPNPYKITGGASTDKFLQTFKLFTNAQCTRTKEMK